MTTRKILCETGTIAPDKSQDTFPVTIITEGEGSTGHYSAELLERHGNVFDGALSFMNHPLDPDRPHLRDVTGIAGRIVSGSVRTEALEDGRKAVKGTFKPDPRWREFIQEYADVLGLSIYIGASGTVGKDGKLVVEAFDANDPYKSVDIVVAAGRGGKFDRAAEALRTIESSVGQPADPEPDATSAQENNKKKDHMEKQEIKELFESILDAKLAPIVSFVSESVDSIKAKAKAEVQVEADDAAVTAALENFRSAVEAINAAELPEELEKTLLEAAEKGEDIAPRITEYKTVGEAFTKRLSEGGNVVRGGVIESGSDDYVVAGWSRN